MFKFIVRIALEIRSELLAARKQKIPVDVNKYINLVGYGEQRMQGSNWISGKESR